MEKHKEFKKLLRKAIAEAVEFGYRKDSASSLVYVENTVSEICEHLENNDLLNQNKEQEFVKLVYKANKDSSNFIIRHVLRNEWEDYTQRADQLLIFLGVIEHETFFYYHNNFERYSNNMHGDFIKIMKKTQIPSDAPVHLLPINKFKF